MPHNRTLGDLEWEDRWSPRQLHIPVRTTAFTVHPKDTGKRGKRNCQSSEEKSFTEVGLEPSTVRSPVDALTHSATAPLPISVQYPWQPCPWLVVTVIDSMSNTLSRNLLSIIIIMQEHCICQGHCKKCKIIFPEL